MKSLAISLLLASSSYAEAHPLHVRDNEAVQLSSDSKEHQKEDP